MWQGGMHGRGVGGVCSMGVGACMAGGMLGRAMCMAGGMHGRGHAWQGVCV